MRDKRRLTLLQQLKTKSRLDKSHKSEDTTLIGRTMSRERNFASVVYLKTNGGSEWGPNPPVTPLDATRRF